MRNFRCRISQKSRRSLFVAALIVASPTTLLASDDAQPELDSAAAAAELMVVSPSDVVAENTDQGNTDKEDAIPTLPRPESSTEPASREDAGAVAIGEVTDNETEPQTQGMIAETRPTLVVPGKTSGYRTQANSTLKMKPVAGPFFGRSNSRRPVLQFFQGRQAEDKEAVEKKTSAAVPKPKSMSHPQIAQRHQQQIQQFKSTKGAIASPATTTNPKFTAQRRHALARPNEAENVTNEKGWVSRGSALRDPGPPPSYALDPPSIESPKLAPSKTALSEPALSEPRLSDPRESSPKPTTEAKRSEPILVSPIAPKKEVPSRELTTRKAPAKPKTEPADGIRSQLQANSIERRTESAPNRIASRSRDEARLRVQQDLPQQSATGRAGDLDEGAISQAPVSLDYVGLPAQPFQIGHQVRQMKRPIERVLQHFYDNPEIAAGRSNWGMMHAIMVYGVDTQLIANNRRYSTIAWIAGNNICRGQRLLTHDQNGIKAKSGVGLQGHQAQMLAVFSLCEVPANYPLYAGNTKYSVQDIIEVEKRDCKSGEELTFTLIGLSHYLDTDAAWIAGDGQRWDFQRLIAEELSQPIVGTACGGTHRLMGFAHALRKRREEGKPIVGQWARAEYFLRDFTAYTYQLQNRDGSMSTNWFEGRGDSGDLDRKIQTTGHMVEYLLTVTPDSQLQDPRLVRAVRFLMASMHNDLHHEWKIGPKGHALRSLAMYHDRVFQSGPAWQRQRAQTASQGNLYR